MSPLRGWRVVADSWVVRPDGSTSSVLDVIKKYWSGMGAISRDSSGHLSWLR
jgi:hypothetical protein